jgi:hypothetical protein
LNQHMSHHETNDWESEFLVGSSWENAADDQAVIDFSANVIATLNKKAKAAGLLYPFVYLNDAAAGQNIFQYYGGGKSLKKLKAIRRIYGTYKPL